MVWYLTVIYALTKRVSPIEQINFDVHAKAIEWVMKQLVLQKLQPTGSLSANLTQWSQIISSSDPISE